MPSQSGLLHELPQLQSVTRLRGSKAWPSERSIEMEPVTQSGPAMGPSDVISVVTAICWGRSGSTSASSLSMEYVYEPDGHRSIMAMTCDRTLVSAVSFTIF